MARIDRHEVGMHISKGIGEGFVYSLLFLNPFLLYRIWEKLKIFKEDRSRGGR